MAVSKIKSSLAKWIPAAQWVHVLKMAGSSMRNDTLSDLDETKFKRVVNKTQRKTTYLREDIKLHLNTKNIVHDGDTVDRR